MKSYVRLKLLYSVNEFRLKLFYSVNELKAFFNCGNLILVKCTYLTINHTIE